MTSKKRKHRKSNVPDLYAGFAEHPRYGGRPQITGLDPKPDDEGVNLHWNAGSVSQLAEARERDVSDSMSYGTLIDDPDRSRRIENTAVLANLDRQTPAIFPVTHYFDVERRCEDCGQGFIFFALEQKHWYEVLGFSLNSGCVRCAPCRKKKQGVARRREAYEALFHTVDKTENQSLEMAEISLDLIESGVFPERQLERVRMLMNSLPKNSPRRKQSRYKELVKRVQSRCS